MFFIFTYELGPGLDQWIKALGNKNQKPNSSLRPLIVEGVNQPKRLSSDLHTYAVANLSHPSNK